MSGTRGSQKQSNWNSPQPSDALLFTLLTLHKHTLSLSTLHTLYTEYTPGVLLYSTLLTLGGLGVAQPALPGSTVNYFSPE
jgi:hypothetical protein